MSAPYLRPVEESFPEPATEKLWREYSEVFRNFDDATLARWMSQTLGQLEGRRWRFSHPLLGAYRLAAQVAHGRQIWLQRLVTLPASYSVADCCRAPLLPVFTRDILETGLGCLHCNETAVEFEELPESLRQDIENWSAQYQPVHAVAHWDDRQRKESRDYEQAFERAAMDAERLLVAAGRELVPRFLETFPAIAWEDQDECLEVRPEDLEL